MPANPKTHQLVLGKNGSRQAAKKGMMKTILIRKMMYRVMFRKLLGMEWWFYMRGAANELSLLNTKEGMLSKEGLGMLCIFVVGLLAPLLI